MIRRAKPILLFTLVFAAVALLGSAPAWAVKPACQEVQIFQNTIKFVWSPDCEQFEGVFFWKGALDPPLYDDTCIDDCSPNNPVGCTGTPYNECWNEGVEIALLICTCEGSECVGDDFCEDASGKQCVPNEDPDCKCGIYVNIARDAVSTYNVTVVCDTTPIKDSGPSLGVPLFLNPPRACVGARCYQPRR
jgi:hypothetical protein